MKKHISILILLVLILGVTGCNILKKDKNQINESNIENTITSKETLVLYFSATGTTKNVAKKIAKVIKSDIIEIIPKQEYTEEDLNYSNNNCRANKEQNDSSSRPEIKNDINIEKYKRVYIGYPIWWGTNPKIILTLIDKYDFNDKDVVLFCTSGGTDISQSINDLKKYNPKMNVLDGKRFLKSVSDDEIKSWINGLK